MTYELFYLLNLVFSILLLTSNRIFTSESKAEDKAKEPAPKAPMQAYSHTSTDEDIINYSSLQNQKSEIEQLIDAELNDDPTRLDYLTAGAPAPRSRSSSSASMC